MMRRFSLGLGIWLVFCFSHQAWTQSIFVGGLQVENEDLSKVKLLEPELRKSFEQLSRLGLVSVSRVEAWKSSIAGVDPQSSPKNRLKQARTLLSDGKRAYRLLNLDEATQALEEARKLFITDLDQLMSSRDLVDVHIYLAMTAQALNDQKKAEVEFKRAVNLDPNYELRSKEYSPDVISQYSKSRSEVLSQSPLRVEFSSDPSDAAVYINGRLQGQSPLVTQLRPGDYFVMVKKEGLKPWYKLVSIERRLERIEAKLDFEMDMAKWSNLFRVREGSAQQSSDLGRVLSMANEEGASLVLLASLLKQPHYRLLGQLLDVDTGQFSKVSFAEVEASLDDFPGASDEVVKSLLALVDDKGRLKPPEAGGRPDLTVGALDRPQDPAPVAMGPKKAWYQHWWIYPIIVGVGVGAYFGAKQLAGSDGIKVIVDNGN